MTFVLITFYALLQRSFILVCIAMATVTDECPESSQSIQKLHIVLLIITEGTSYRKLGIGN